MSDPRQHPGSQPGEFGRPAEFGRPPSVRGGSCVGSPQPAAPQPPAQERPGRGAGADMFARPGAGRAQRIVDVREPHDTSRTRDTDAQTVRTGPWAWVAAAALAAGIGLLLGLGALLGLTPTDPVFAWVSFLGWALGGIGCFVLLGVHITEDTKRRAEGPYIGTPAQVTTYRAAVVLGLMAVLATAIAIALWASKLNLGA